MLETLVSQLMDPFRIGLILFLFLTALRTRAAMGLAMPLGLGLVFVAILLPLTTGANSGTDNQARLVTIAIGLVSNAIVLFCLMAAWWAWKKLRR